jgi:hypothetical protein
MLAAHKVHVRAQTEKSINANNCCFCTQHLQEANAISRQAAPRPNANRALQEQDGSRGMLNHNLRA